MTVWPNGSKTIPRVSSEYGMRTHPISGVPLTFHYGIDLGHDWDAVRAPASGTIIFAGYNGAAGNEVRIRADNGDVFRLLHNRAFVRTSGRVSEGEQVAWMGTTGSSTGVHCHFETKPGGGSTINPRDYMARAIGGSGAGSGSTPFGGFLMALSDAQQAQMYDALVSPQGWYLTQAIINILRGETAPAIATIAAGGTMFPGAGYNAWVAIANAVHGVGDLVKEEGSADVDEEALANALAPAIAPLIIEQAGTLSDDSIDRLLNALLKEQAARLAVPSA